MKRILLLFGIVLSSMLYSNWIQAQTTQSKLDQLELMKQFLGTWKWEINIDTVFILEFKQYGKAFVETDYLVTKGNKNVESIWSFSYYAEKDQFRIFGLYSAGYYLTLIGSFTIEKKWEQKYIQDFNPEIVTGSAEIIFETPKSFLGIVYDSKGIKTLEARATKVE
jgi:hypothetical protein